MKTIISLLCMTAIILIVAPACGSREKRSEVRTKDLTYGVVKKEVRVGYTNQDEVVRLLGSPNIITKNRRGNEVWTYTRQSYDAESGVFGGGIILFGGSRAFSSAASRSFDLIIEWNNNGIVEDYSVISTSF